VVIAGWPQRSTCWGTLHCEEALALYRAVDDRRGASILLSNLGVLAQDEGDLERAARLLSESIQYKRTLGNRYGLANSLDSLGSVERSRGNHAQASALYTEALTIRREIGHRQGIAISLNNLGHLALAEDNAEQARTCFLQSLPILRELEEKEGLLECLSGLAGAAALRGENTNAAQLCGAVKALRESERIQVSQEELAAEKQGRDRACAGLGEDDFAVAIAQGERMGWNEATNLALGQAEKES
jgi:tetratricopeptide (TPR) repeat protein